MDSKEEKQQEQETVTANDLFTIDPDRTIEDEENLDLFDSDQVQSGFDGLEDQTNEQEQQQEEEAESQEEEGLFEGQSSENEDEAELAVLNKYLDKDFKSREEAKEFLNAQQQEKELEESKVEYDRAISSLERFEILVDTEKTSDEQLMREQFTTIAMQNNKDINSAEVREEIDDQIADLIDRNALRTEARLLRYEIQQKGIDPNKKIVAEYEAKEEAKRAAEVKSFEESAQKSLADIFHNDNWFGVKVEKKDIQNVYQEVRSGNFLKEVQNDASLQSELAMLRRFKEVIFKKATGSTYSDGVKSVLDEFKSSKQASRASRAQQRGSSGSGSRNTPKGLIEALTSEEPVE